MMIPAQRGSVAAEAQICEHGLPPPQPGPAASAAQGGSGAAAGPPQEATIPEDAAGGEAADAAAPASDAGPLDVPEREEAQRRPWPTGAGSPRCLLPDADAATDAGACSDGPPPAGAPSGALVVHIETALHLEVDAAGAAGGGSAAPHRSYVSVVWAGQRHAHATHAVPVLAAPPMGGTAAWDSTLLLPATAAAFEGTGGDGTLEAAPLPGPLLLLNLWRTPGRSSSCSSPVTDVAAAGRLGSGPGAEDSLLGCAAVDLSLLPVLGEVVGWYPVISAQQARQGQLRVHVRPDQALASQLAAPAPLLAAAAPAPAAAGAPGAGEGGAAALEPLSQRALGSLAPRGLPLIVTSRRWTSRSRW